MADQTHSYGADSKGTYVNVDPALLTVVGLDCEESERPELADPQRLQLGIDPEMVRSIRTYGIQEVVRIRRFVGDDHTYVVSGRRRVIHARKANEELPDGEKILIPCLPIGRGSDVAVSHIIGNRFRVDSTPLMNAEEAARQLERGRTPAQVCDLFGISRATLTNWQDLRASAPFIRKAVESGKLSVTRAVEITRTVEPAKQAEAVDAAVAAGGGVAAQEAVALRKRRNGDGGEDKPRRLSMPTLKKFGAALSADGAQVDESVTIAASVVSAILGDPKPLKNYPAVQKILREVTR